VGRLAVKKDPVRHLIGNRWNKRHIRYGGKRCAGQEAAGRAIVMMFAIQGMIMKEGMEICKQKIKKYADYKQGDT
jgi:hypothetical protein